MTRDNYAKRPGGVEGFFFSRTRRRSPSVACRVTGQLTDRPDESGLSNEIRRINRLELIERECTSGSERSLVDVLGRESGTRPGTELTGEFCRH